MNTLLVIAGLCAAAFATPILNKDLDNDWALFKQTHTKSYSQEEEQMRRLIWEDNVNYIQKHNLAADRGEHTFWLGQNEYADMTIFEFRAVMNGYIMSANRTKGQTYLSPSNIGAAPDSVDWRDKGYVTPIKNQGHCGSCWSFSATGSLEGQHFKATNKLVSLSEQNLVDCSQREGNHGCKGGLMDNAFRYIEQNKGIDTEESYPYKAKDGFCRFKEADVGATDTGYVDIPHQSEEKLAEAVATVGPIAVAMDAGHKSFQLYKEGIYKEPACSSRKLDHGVLAVGYGAENGKNYWIVKNSWGTSWGMRGYFQLAKDDNNMCGIATQASYPKV